MCTEKTRQADCKSSIVKVSRIDVCTPRNGFVCNIGDLMMRWWNDRWVSTLHRVAVSPPDAVPVDRISLVFFQNPNPDTIVRCFDSCVASGEQEKYPPITVAEHYLGKLMKAAHSRLDAKAEVACGATPDPGDLLIAPPFLSDQSRRFDRAADVTALPQTADMGPPIVRLENISSDCPINDHQTDSYGLPSLRCSSCAP